MKAGLILMAVWMAAASSPLTAATLYQWKDADGRTVFSDQPPPASVKNAQQKTLKASRTEGGEREKEKSTVILYNIACGAVCDKARALLTERGVPFTSKDPQASEEARNEVLKLTGKLKAPVLVIGNEKVEGFEPKLWHAALDRAGYPPAAQPGGKSAQ